MASRLPFAENLEPPHGTRNVLDDTQLHVSVHGRQHPDQSLNGEPRYSSAPQIGHSCVIDLEYLSRNARIEMRDAAEKSVGELALERQDGVIEHGSRYRRRRDVRYRATATRSEFVQTREPRPQTIPPGRRCDLTGGNTGHL